jgi:hypothetical protein
MTIARLARLTAANVAPKPVQAKEVTAGEVQPAANAASWAEDVAWLLDGIALAATTGCTIEQGLCLAPNWRDRLKAEQARQAFRDMSERELARRLKEYASRCYRADRLRPRAPGTERRLMFDMVLRNNGAAPSRETLRRWGTCKQTALSVSPDNQGSNHGQEDRTDTPREIRRVDAVRRGADASDPEARSEGPELQVERT